VFTVTLSGPSSQPVGVSYRTVNSTARAPVDYVSTGGTVTIPAGQMTGTISVPVKGDTVIEADKRFLVTLTSATNATIAPSGKVAFGTIIDDDGAPRVLVEDTTRVEGNAGRSNAVFTVRLTRASSQEVTVSFATIAGTAGAGSDYVARRGTLTIAAGQTSARILVPIVGDTLLEANEQFRLTLSAPTNAALVPLARQATGTILNDDR